MSSLIPFYCLICHRQLYSSSLPLLCSAVNKTFLCFACNIATVEKVWILINYLNDLHESRVVRFFNFYCLENIIQAAVIHARTYANIFINFVREFSKHCSLFHNTISLKTFAVYSSTEKRSPMSSSDFRYQNVALKILFSKLLHQLTEK